MFPTRSAFSLFLVLSRGAFRTRCSPAGRRVGTHALSRINWICCVFVLSFTLLFLSFPLLLPLCRCYLLASAVALPSVSVFLPPIYACLLFRLAHPPGSHPIYISPSLLDLLYVSLFVYLWTVKKTCRVPHLSRLKEIGNHTQLHFHISLTGSSSGRTLFGYLGWLEGTGRSAHE